ncbi:MAG: DUF309 domain-containing protein [Planctomycetota bacterium]|nr:DUF309 domain-containing protein [Planctomycetota bacterium]
MTDLVRYAPQRPFPAYAFLPGRDPHPTRQPDGHSYTGEPEPAQPYLPAEGWRTNEEYLYGVDLYNHGYLWEAHEAWEGLWHPAKVDDLLADFLQGLIQCTAASLKVPMGQPNGLAKLAELGTGRLERVERVAGPEFMGLEIEPFVGKFRAFATSDPQSADERPRIQLEIE